VNNITGIEQCYFLPALETSPRAVGNSSTGEAIGILDFFLVVVDGFFLRSLVGGGAVLLPFTFSVGRFSLFCVRTLKV
jgi:hypothetical protein